MKTMKQISLLAILAVFFYSCATNFSSRKHQRLTYIKVQPNNGIEQDKSILESRKLITDEVVTQENNMPINKEKTNSDLPLAAEPEIFKIEKKQASAQQELTTNEIIKSEVSTEQLETTSESQKEKNATPDSDAMFVLQIIFAFFLPPLAVYLKEQITGRFWLTLVLCLLSFSIFFGPFYFGGLWLIAIIIALLVVLDII